MDKNKVIESASKLIAKGQLEKAVKEYQRILEVDPDDVRVLQKLAELFQKMQRREEAADCFEKVARTYAAQGFYLKAVALYKQVLKVVDRIEVSVRLAELYQQLGLVGDAAKEWQNVAAFYEKAGDTKASLETLKKLVDLDPDNVAARIRLGEQFARQDNIKEAVSELRRAAQYLQRNARQEEYAKVAERISHLDPDDIGLAKELAESYLSRGDSKRALAKLQVCFKADSKDLRTLQMLAHAFQDLGQASKTVSVLKEIARIHQDQGRAAEAEKALTQALALAPDDPELRGAPAAPAAAPVGRPPPPPAQSNPPASDAAPVPLAALQLQKAPAGGGEPAPSASAPRPPAGAGGGNLPKLLKETEVYIKYGLHAKAQEHIARILSLDPELPEAHEKAKALALAVGQPERAAQALGQLIRIYGKQGDPREAEARRELENLDLAPAGGAAAQASPPPPPAVSAGRDDFELDREEEEVLELDAEPETSSPPISAAPQDAESDDEIVADEEFGDLPLEPEPEAAPPAPASLPVAAQAQPELARSAPKPAPSQPVAKASEHEIEIDTGSGEDELQLHADTEELLVPSEDEPVEAEEPGFDLSDDELVEDDSELPGALDLGEELPAPAHAASAAEEDPFGADLSEADFYLQAGLVDDARAILESILLASPGHPQAEQRLRELQAEAGLSEQAEPPAQAEAPQEHSTGNLFGNLAPAEDLAAELAAELADEVAQITLDDDSSQPLDAGSNLDAFQVPAHEVLGQFREKVSEVVRPEDVQTHFDLGIAYREMGLVDEAIAEFNIGLTHGEGRRRVDCLHMLGLCALEQGRPDDAAQSFEQALAEVELPEDARRAIGYDLASAYEAMGASGEAVSQYVTLAEEDPSYRDVADRLKALGAQIPQPRPPTSAPAKAAAPAAKSGKPTAGAPGRAPAGAGQAAAPTPDAEPEPGVENTRRNRKIGFV